jgi:hypothetical protein
VTRKPVWLLVSYLVWQTLMIGTGISLAVPAVGRSVMSVVVRSLTRRRQDRYALCSEVGFWFRSLYTGSFRAWRLAGLTDGSMRRGMGINVYPRRSE